MQSNEEEMSERETVTLGETEYFVDDLTDEGKRIVQSLRFVDQEIGTLQNKIAVLNTAKSAYLASLKLELPSQPQDGTIQ